MIKGRCPICSRHYAIAGLADLPSFPFCSERCRMIDLGRWIDGAYAIPAPEVPQPDELPTAGGDDGEDGAD